MIKFEFTIYDTEAEILFDCINSQISYIMDFSIGKNSAIVEECNRHIEVLENLKKKMKNKKVNE